jgi:hypothetical protein
VLVLLVVVAVLLAAFSGVASLRQRVRDGGTPRPSLPTRRWIVAGVTLAGVTAHLWSWLPLRPIVPPHASAGSVVYGGPGDGLWLLLMVLVPWVCMQPLNVCLACFCARSGKQAALIASLLVGVWMGTAALGGALTRCPVGFVCTGG